MDAGFDMYVNKPVDPDDLCYWIARLAGPVHACTARPPHNPPGVACNPLPLTLSFRNLLPHGAVKETLK
jgi:hypothetical protein